MSGTQGCVREGIVCVKQGDVNFLVFSLFILQKPSYCQCIQPFGPYSACLSVSISCLSSRPVLSLRSVLLPDS